MTVDDTPDPNPSGSTPPDPPLWDAARGVTRLATGGTWLEGPCDTPWGLLVSDIPANRVLRWNGSDGFDVVADGAEFPNGRTVSSDGRVFQCSHGRRAVEELHADATTTPVATSYRGVRLNSPNDVIVASDGGLWFTDPPYGIVQAHEGHPGVREYGDHFVFRHDPQSGEVRAVVTDIEEPNGLALSPDESILYVADSSAALAPAGQGNRHLRAYDVIEGRACKNGRTIFTATHGLADGFRVDAAGRLWTSNGPTVTVLSPAGAVLTEIAIPERVGNLCFGGPDGSELFVAASTSLYRLHTHTRDAARRG